METRKTFAASFMQQPEFQEWKRANPHHDDWGIYEAYEHANARMSTMMYSLNLLWPHFVEYDGLLLRDAHGRSQEEWKVYLQGFREAKWRDTQIEYTVNHIHLSQDTFTADPGWSKIDRSVWLSLAHTIADIWQSRLRELFPYKQCVVQVDDEENVIYMRTIRDEDIPADAAPVSKG